MHGANPAMLLGLTKDIKFRKQQLQNMIRFCEENTNLIIQALWSDLHKHAMETNVGEISPIVAECKFMIENLDKFAKPVHTKKRFLMNAADKTFIRKEAKGVVLIMGKHEYNKFHFYILTFYYRCLELSSNSTSRKFEII